MAAPEGVSVAFGSDALNTAPDWVRIDDPAGIQVVTGWQIRRGRTYITDVTETGTAQADFADTVGALDPTNTTGPFWPMNPNCPFAIALYNPVAEEWVTLFTGLVQQVPQTMDVSARVCKGSVMAQDLFSLLAIAEIPPGVDFADANDGTNTANEIGDTTYSQQAVDDRILTILADAGITDPDLLSIFSGNVQVQATIEPPGTNVLPALQDAAEAEFPAVANLFVTKAGATAFRGRLSRFDPTNPDYDINTWNVGDQIAVDADSSLALIAGLSFDRDVAKVINAALITPENIADADIPGQLVADADSVEAYGPRTYSGQNLIVAGGEGDDDNDAEEECVLFGTFFKDNFKDAQTNITQLTFRWVPLGAPNDAAHWAFLCGVELGDVVNVTTTHPGGGGFSAQPYFVEGISYQAVPGLDNPDITLTLDLSPGAYFTPDSNPFT